MAGVMRRARGRVRCWRGSRPQAWAIRLTCARGRALLTALCRTCGGEGPMTADGGTNPGTNWDEARIALRRVAYFLKVNSEFDLEELRGLENYELIPEPVRETLEGLTPEERQIVEKVFITLEENHFY